MSPTTLFRLSGWATILSGLCLIIDTVVIEPFLPQTVLTNSVGHLSVLLGFFAVIGIYLWQREESGLLGGLGFIVNFLGLGLISGVMFYRNYIGPFLSADAIQIVFAGPTRAIFLFSALLFEIGVILFGITTFRAGKFPRLAAVLFMVGYTAYLVEAFVPETGIVDLIIRTAQVTGALGVIWLGYTLTTNARTTRTAGLVPSIQA